MYTASELRAATEPADPHAAIARRVSRRRPMASAAGLTMALGILAGCGSGSDATSDADQSPATTTSTTDAGAETVATDATVPTDTGQQPPEGPPREAPGGAAHGGDSLAEGPQNVGEHGPFSNADFDRDGTVTRDELDQFMDGALEREVGLVAFFELNDVDGNDIIDADELSVVDPPYAFDGSDANADGEISLAEATAYANEEGRSYRAIGLGAFFDLVDTNLDNEASPEEIEAAHASGLLARF